MSEPAMFPAPPAPKLQLSKHFAWTARQDAPKYAAYRLKTRVQCEECVWVVHEARGAGGAAIRSATIRRKCMDAEILMCEGHARLWEEREAAAPAEAAREARAARDAARANARAVAAAARTRGRS